MHTRCPATPLCDATLADWTDGVHPLTCLCHQALFDHEMNTMVVRSPCTRESCWPETDRLLTVPQLCRHDDILLPACCHTLRTLVFSICRDDCTGAEH